MLDDEFLFFYFAIAIITIFQVMIQIKHIAST